MEMQDLHNYRSRWLPPRRIRYRDHDVYGAAGRSYGGVWSLLALKTLEHFDMSGRQHFSESADRLEVMVRIARTIWNEAWLYETDNLDNDQPDSRSGKMWLDPKISKEVVEELFERGLDFERESAFVDTGSGAIAILHEDGSVEAALLPLIGHEQDEPAYIVLLEN